MFFQNGNKYSSSTACTLTRGLPFTYNTARLLSNLAFWDNEAVGCRGGLFILNMGPSESDFSSCAVVAGIKAWRNGHTGKSGESRRGEVIMYICPPEFLVLSSRECLKFKSCNTFMLVVVLLNFPEDLARSRPYFDIKCVHMILEFIFIQASYLPTPWPTFSLPTWCWRRTTST